MAAKFCGLQIKPFVHQPELDIYYKDSTGIVYIVHFQCDSAFCYTSLILQNLPDSVTDLYLWLYFIKDFSKNPLLKNVFALPDVTRKKKNVYWLVT